MSKMHLLEAIGVAKENERVAATSYREAAGQITNPGGKELFEQLAAFENHHYQILTDLETSLKDSGEYVNYEGTEMPLPPIFTIKAAEEPNSKSVMKIITEAMELEKVAENTYADLAMQCEDPKGYATFLKLSEEEHKHFQILRDAYWALSNLGTWTWTK